MSENEKKVPYKYRLINDSLESYNKTVMFTWIYILNNASKEKNSK